MNEVKYSESIFRDIAGMRATVTHYVGPVLSLVVAIIWFSQSRGYTSGLATVGGILILGSTIVRAMNPDKGDFVYVGWLHPYNTENSIIAFLQLYGSNIGLCLFLIALTIYFTTKWRRI